MLQTRTCVHLSRNQANTDGFRLLSQQAHRLCTHQRIAIDGSRQPSSDIWMSLESKRCVKVPDSISSPFFLMLILALTLVTTDQGQRQT